MTKKKTIIYKRCIVPAWRGRPGMIACAILILGVLFLLAMPAVAMLMEPDLFDGSIPISDVRPATFAEQLIGASLFFGGLLFILLGLFAFLTLL